MFKMHIVFFLLLHLHYVGIQAKKQHCAHVQIIRAEGLSCDHYGDCECEGILKCIEGKCAKPPSFAETKPYCFTDVPLTGASGSICSMYDPGFYDWDELIDEGQYHNDYCAVDPAKLTAAEFVVDTESENGGYFVWEICRECGFCEYAPTQNPTVSPSDPPSRSPTTSSPSQKPVTSRPTYIPTVSKPTVMPTDKPSKNPSISSPSAHPIPSDPSIAPSPTNPSKAPITSDPTNIPSDIPTRLPSDVPSDNPTRTPSANPSPSPTEMPTPSPTESPTTSPSDIPTSSPSNRPSRSPTESPTSFPSESPTSSPTVSPTSSPSNRPTSSPTSEMPTVTAPTKTPFISIELTLDMDCPDDLEAFKAELSSEITKLNDQVSVQGVACGSVIITLIGQNADDINSVSTQIVDTGLTLPSYGLVGGESSEQDTEQADTEKKSTTTVVVVIISIVLVLVLLATIWFLGRHLDKTKQEKEAEMQREIWSKQSRAQTLTRKVVNEGGNDIETPTAERQTFEMKTPGEQSDSNTAKQKPVQNKPDPAKERWTPTTVQLPPSPLVGPTSATLTLPQRQSTEPDPSATTI